MFAINGIIQFNSKDVFFLIEIFQRQFNRQLKNKYQRSWGNDQQTTSRVINEKPLNLSSI